MNEAQEILAKQGASTRLLRGIENASYYVQEDRQVHHYDTIEKIKAELAQHGGMHFLRTAGFGRKSLAELQRILAELEGPQRRMVIELRGTAAEFNQLSLLLAAAADGKDDVLYRLAAQLEPKTDRAEDFVDLSDLWW